MFEGQGVDLPPLNAGADVSSVYEPLGIDAEAAEEGTSKTTEVKPETTTETVPESASTESVQPEAKQQEETSTPDDDDHSDVLKALLGEDAEVTTEEESTAPPQGVSAEDWKAFQDWQKAKGATAAEQQEQAPPAEQVKPEDLEITQEDFDAAFDSVDGFKSALGKVSQVAVNAATQAHQQMREQMYGEIDQALQFIDRELTARMERMIYLNELTQDIPEIHTVENYRKAFQIAFEKSMKKAKEGDLRGPVEEAVGIFKRELGEAQKVLKTKNVNVRPKQQAPRGGTQSSRQVHASGKQQQSDPGGLSHLMNVYGGGR